MPDDLTKFRLDCLAAIGRLSQELGRGPKGLEIKEELEEHYGVNEIRHSRLYQNLDDLFGKALVEKNELDARSNEYQLSPRGRRELIAETEWYLRAIAGTEVQVRV